MLTEKIFQNVETHENVSIIGDNGAFYSLSNGANIKKDIFFQKFSERIDPNSFFNSGPTNNLLELSERIKSIDTNKIENIGGNMPSKVRQLQKSVSENIEVPDEYRKMLMKNKEWEENHKDLFEYKVYDNDEDSIQDFERKNTQKQQEPNRNVNRSRPVEQTNVSDYDDSDYVEQNNIVNNSVSHNSVSQNLSPEEESFKFFKSFKRIYPIKLTIDFDEKISDLNFIKLMAVNYEGDIIKYYTKEFMNRIYNDPGFLEDKIYNKLKSIIFEDEQREEPKQKTKYKQNKKSATKESSNDIDDDKKEIN
jgi:hypothetical protein